MSRVRASFPAPKFGALAKRLCSGLQIRLVQFDSGTRLHQKYVCARVVKSVDTRDLKSLGTYTSVPVRFWPRAPFLQIITFSFQLKRLSFFVLSASFCSQNLKMTLFFLQVKGKRHSHFPVLKLKLISAYCVLGKGVTVCGFLTVSHPMGMIEPKTLWKRAAIP